MRKSSPSIQLRFKYSIRHGLNIYLIPSPTQFLTHKYIHGIFHVAF